MRQASFLVILASSLLSAGAAYAQQQPKPTPPAAQPAPAKPAPTARSVSAEPVSVVAPPGELLTLRDALAQAVKGNRTLTSAAIDVQIAEAKVDQAKGVDDFVIDGRLDVSTLRTRPIAGALFQNLSDDRIDLSGGITRGLGTGGRVGVRANVAYNRQVSRFQICSDPAMTMCMDQEQSSESYQIVPQITLFQPLLRGYGSNNQARAAIRRADAQQTIAELQRGQIAGNVVRDVVTAYWELAYAQRNVEIERAALALGREQLRITQAKLDVGVGARTDIAAVEQSIAEREATLLAAELAVSERGYELRALIGMEITAKSLGLAAADRLEPSGGDLSLDEAITRAMSANPELTVVRARGEAAEIEVEVTKNGLLPQLDFTANAGPLGNSNDFGDALSKIGSFETYQVSAGLVFEMPLGNRAAEGAHAAARGELHKVKLNQQDLEAQISVQTARAVNLVATARAQLQALETASRLAQVNLDAEQARFDVGKSTNFDVLQRQEELAQAELKRARAQADYMKALATLQTLTGDILPSYGVELAKK
jgi:outer membrane protein